MTALSQLNHPNLVFIHYWPYQGGKFFANCLAHHDSVMPQLNQHQKCQPSCKLKYVHDSLPPFDHINQWVKYELGCRGFWGVNLHDIMNRDLAPHADAIKMLDHYKCFLINHCCHPDFIRKLQTDLPHAFHIVLTNGQRFLELAVKLKQPGASTTEWLERNHMDPLAYLQSPVYTYSGPGLFVVDVDSVYFDRSAVRPQVQKCLKEMGLSTDLDPSLEDFIDRYFDLHGID